MTTRINCPKCQAKLFLRPAQYGSMANGNGGLPIGDHHICYICGYYFEPSIGGPRSAINTDPETGKTTAKPKKRKYKAPKTLRLNALIEEHFERIAQMKQRNMKWPDIHRQILGDEADSIIIGTFVSRYLRYKKGLEQ